MKKITTILATAIACAALTACGTASDQDHAKSQNTSSAVSTTAAASGSATKSSAKDVPNYKGRSLYDAVTDLRERKVAYKPVGEGFVFKDEVKRTRDWTVTGQKVIDNGSTVELMVERAKK